MRRSYTLRHDDVPKSLNNGGLGSRTHWGAAARQKKQWGGIWLAELLRAKVAKGAERVEINVLLEFRDGRKRDKDNYLGGVLKPLQDAIVTGGYLPDDNGNRVRIGVVEIQKGDFPKLPKGAPRTPGRTSVGLMFHYAEES